MKEFPKISIIIPVLDAIKDRYLELCIRSIKRSTYPQDKIQVIIKEGLPAEEAKGQALREVEGEYVCFLDSDNILLPFYLETAVKALEGHPNAFGVEAKYGLTYENRLNAFLTHELHISDPISWLISTKPKHQNIDQHYDRCWLRNSSLAYPLGANGFVYRKCDLDRVNAEFEFEDTQIPLRLMKVGFLYWIKTKLTGVDHYYVDNLWQFFLKRRRQTVHYLLKKEKGTNTINWTMLGPRMPKWLAFLYCVTVLGPFLTMLKNLRKSKLWLWWPLACFVSALGLLAGVGTYYVSKLCSRNIKEVSLQPSRC